MSRYILACKGGGGLLSASASDVDYCLVRSAICPPMLFEFRKQTKIYRHRTSQNIQASDADYCLVRSLCASEHVAVHYWIIACKHTLLHYCMRRMMCDTLLHAKAGVRRSFNSRDDCVRERRPRPHRKGAASMQTHPAARKGPDRRPTASGPASFAKWARHPSYHINHIAPHRISLVG